MHREASWLDQNQLASPVHIQTGPNIQFESVPRDTEESEFLDSVDFGGVAFSVETVMVICRTDIETN